METNIRCVPCVLSNCIKQRTNDDMKKTDSSKLWSYFCSRLSVLILAGGLFVACDKEETGGVTPLPDGKYPLQLTAEVAQQPQTRAGGKETWTGGEEIGVTVEGYIGGMPKTYVMDASGNAVPKDAANTIYGKNTDEARITAWTPPYINGSPDVDISDQSGGYAAFDVLYASAVGRYGQTINLRFNHRMAKMEITLAADEGVTEEEVEGATVTLLGDSEAYFSCGMVGAADQSDGEIKPYHDAATKKYEAVVVPQYMTGKPLIRIAVGSDVFTYTPDTDAAGNLKSGKRYTYAITVKANGIEVQAATSGTWSDGGEESVSSKEVKRSFTADELKIGDYFYSDGTWSDGGLRKRYDDGSVAIAEPKPAPVMVNPTTGASRAVVGIVFQTDKSRIGAKEKEKLGGEGKVHGLVMAVKNAATDRQRWGPYGQDEGLTKCNTKADNYNDISGYGNCEHIRTNRGNFDNYPAFKAAYDYNTTCPVSATTTGWYFPSSGQWWDILQNLGGCPALAKQDEQTSSQSGDFTWTGQGDVPAALNAWMEKIATDSKDNFRNGDWFWSSSEYSDYRARLCYVSDRGSVYCEWSNKSSNFDVRPVLAF